MLLVLLVYIFLYVFGKSIFFGCGNFSWGVDIDCNFSIERWFKWLEKGYIQIIFKFYQEVFNVLNLMGIFVGYIYRNFIEMIKGKFQIVLDDSVSGVYLDISFLLLVKKDRKLIL